MSDWITAISSAVGSISGEDDLSLGTVSILNNQSSSQTINGFVFSPSSCRSFYAEYSCVRATASIDARETGEIVGQYNGSSFDWELTKTGDAGISFDITSAGQVKYYSSNIAGASYSGTIKFKARTFSV